MTKPTNKWQWSAILFPVTLLVVNLTALATSPANWVPRSTAGRGRR